jgi:hypothetical protein
MVTLLWPGDFRRCRGHSDVCPDGGGQLLVNDWLDEGGSGAPRAHRKGREGKGKGRDDMMTAVVQTFAWNIMKPFDFWADLSFCFYICLYIYIYVCLFMMTNDRSLSVYLILEVEWLWPMCRTRAGWNVGFFYWDQFADEVSGSGQLGCLVRSSSSRSLAWSWIFESFDHDLQLYIMIYDDLWWSMIVFTSLVRTAAVRNAPVMRNRNSGPGS